VSSILTGICLALVLAVIAGFVLADSQKESYQAYATQSTRVGDPGDNLVGKNWTGDPGHPDSAL
jgi:hypothetical protein